MADKMIALNKIRSLVDRFEEQKEFYTKTDYNETQTRRDFIDPFWKALGWDIDNENGYAESYREVIHEDRVKVGGATKAPDYSFRLAGGKRLFFLEAKKPSVAIKSDIQPAYQVRRYGWSAKMPISVITDFEEFAIYDCNTKPKPTDKASHGRIKYIAYSDYINEFDFIWDTFSKERVLKGSFDKYIIGNKNKKGTTTVDNEFLQSLDKWRVQLALNIALRNKDIQEDELNFVVQHTIDRIIFLRIAEDRGAEPYGELQHAVKTGSYYQNLLHNFHIADQKYNSGLFDFKKDKASTRITIDNKVIKNIISEFYYPVCPYEFSVLPVEILGSAYEQFLGKQILLSSSGRAKIQEKPEVRKAGGVYYTPQYVVDYIVKNTVGKLVEGKTPKEISKIKICDPACGSGSFLIGAFQYLLDWHKDYYSAGNDSTSRGARGRKKDALTLSGELTTAEKKRILLNNIYGVDLDSNAVEVTKLSLLLKCMEGETKETIEAQTKLFHDRLLPTLDDNIRNGNSLIDLDYYDNELDFGDEKRIKPFSWEKAFSTVFKNGGFNCIIGNPPWVDLKGHPPEFVKYYFKKFDSTENRINLYSIFIEKSLDLLTDKGVFGFIIPNSLLYQSSYEKIRKIILKNWNVDSIVRLPDNVFYGVKAETIILTINNKPKALTRCLLYDRNDVTNNIDPETAKETKYLKSKDWSKNEFLVFDIFNNEQEKLLLKKIEANKIKLSELCDFTLGITPYDKYKGHTSRQITERVFHSLTKKDETFKPLLEGADVKRYFVQWGGKEYISYGDWLGAPRQRRFFTDPRILIRQIVSGDPPRIYAGYTAEELYNTQSVFNVIAKDNNSIDLKYLLAIINSNVINFYHRHKYLDLSKNLFQKILIQNCKNFPVKVIDPKKKEEVQQKERMIKLVDQLLHFNKELQNATFPHKFDRLKNRIEYTEKKVNQIIYELYGLTAEEIKLVEK